MRKRVNSLKWVLENIYMAGAENDSIELPFWENYEKYKELTKEILTVPEKPKEISWDIKTVKKEIGVLVSGWVDSSACYFMAQKTWKRVLPFYFDIWQPYIAKEISALHAMWIRPFIISLDLSNMKYDWKHIIPWRNGIFIEEVASRIYWGSVYFWVLDWEIKDELWGDKSRKFLDIMQNELSRLPFPVILETPLAEMTKWKVVKWLLDNWYKDILESSITCFSEEKGHCGKCQACFRKFLAFKLNWLDLETKYDVITYWKPYAEKYIKLMEEALNNKDFSVYSRNRCEEDLPLIKKYFLT